LITIQAAADREWMIEGSELTDHGRSGHEEGRVRRDGADLVPASVSSERHKGEARRRMPMARWFVDRLPQRGVPSVSLRRLLPEAQFVGCADWKVFGCTDDHRRLEPGQVFVAARHARPGYDGHRHVREALDRGAAGVVVERPCPEAGRLQAVVPDGVSAHARICQALAGDPSQHLVTMGITGGFGKTITALMVRSIIEAAGDRCGLVGSLGFCDGLTTRALGAGFDPAAARLGIGSGGSGTIATRKRRAHEPGAFLPSAAGLAALLAEMVKLRCKGGVLEVSSDALASRVYDGIAFHAAVVTDVATQEGLPAEVLLQKRAAKARLIRQVVPGGVAVVNADDPHAEVLGGVNLDARRVAFALEPSAATRENIDVSARLERMDGSGTRLLLHGFDREAAVHLPLIGAKAVTCALAATALAWALEIDRDAVVNGLESVRTVAGHLEAISEGQDFDVRIDGAQTPTDIAQALAALRAVAMGRVHIVVSSEGGSDGADRRRLAEIAEDGADRVIVTLSNPRTEDPDQIVDDLLAGFRRPGKVRVEPDRRLAIETALADARGGDAVLIVGKGRCSYQIFADSVTPFDDHAIARQWLRAHNPTTTQCSA
jgi:UDP-N-acetylmuramoyl-L-alanyl-D-glutamate--2,6-diaminopimelate ligase